MKCKPSCCQLATLGATHSDDDHVHGQERHRDLVHHTVLRQRPEVAALAQEGGHVQDYCQQEIQRVSS